MDNQREVYVNSAFRLKFNRKIVYIFLFIPILIIPSITHGWEFALVGSLSEMYDDNIHLTNDDKENDFITFLMFGLEIFHDGRTQQFGLNGHIYQRFFFNNHDLNDNYQDAELNYEKELFNNHHFSLIDVFQHYPESLEFEDTFGRVSGNRDRYYVNTLNLVYHISLLRDFSISTRYTNEVNKYLTGNTSDSYLDSAGISQNYQWSSEIYTSLFYDYERRRFETGELNSKHSPGLQYIHNIIQELLHFECRYGLSYIKLYNNKNYREPFILGSIIYNIDENNTFSVNYSKQYDISIDSPELFGNWTITGDFSKEFSQLVSGSLAAFYGHGEYITTGSEVKYLGITCSLGYRLGEDTIIQTSYTFSKTNSTIITAEGTEFNDYNRNQIQVALTAEY